MLRASRFEKVPGTIGSKLPEELRQQKNGTVPLKRPVEKLLLLYSGRGDLRMENRLIPYVATTSFGMERILVLAPHPDDEVFGCGGAILRQIAEGGAVQVVVVTDGDFQPNCTDIQKYAQTRRDESCNAAQALGYGNPVFLGLKDRGLEYGEQLVQRLLAQIKTFAPDGVFAPSVYEMHPDHRALGMAAVEAVRRKGGTLKLVMYEVGVPMPRPNVLLDITSAAQDKQTAMACFASQLLGQPYDQQIRALNYFRTYTLGNRVTAAEAYLVVTPSELERGSLELYESEHMRQRSLGFPMMPTDVPLVSVIMDCRNTLDLQDSLDSVALQTYPHVEVILLIDEKMASDSLADRCGRFPLRNMRVASTLGQAAAANLGMKHASGKYLIFLEMGDVFLPDHLAKLVRTLSECNALAACAGVKLIDNEGKLKAILDEPWDTEQLQVERMHPSNAIMFARSLAVAGCQFPDKSGHIDYWDFWRQIAAETVFWHAPGVSAVCRNADVNPSRLTENLRLQTDLLDAQKGFSEASLQLAASQMQVQDFGTQVDMCRAQLDQMTALAAAQAAQTQSLKKTVHALMSSTSWKVTRPLRFLSRAVKGSR